MSNKSYRHSDILGIELEYSDGSKYYRKKFPVSDEAQFKLIISQIIEKYGLHLKIESTKTWLDGELKMD